MNISYLFCLTKIIWINPMFNWTYRSKYFSFVFGAPRRTSRGLSIQATLSSPSESWIPFTAERLNWLWQAIGCFRSEFPRRRQSDAIRVSAVQSSGRWPPVGRRTENALVSCTREYWFSSRLAFVGLASERARKEGRYRHRDAAKKKKPCAVIARRRGATRRDAKQTPPSDRRPSVTDYLTGLWQTVNGEW